MQMNTKTVGAIGAAVSLVFLFSILDTFVSGYLEPKRTYRAFPGTTQPVNGRLEYRVDSPEELTYHSDTPAISIVFIESKGTLWRGTLVVEGTADERDYRFVVSPKGQAPREDAEVHTVRVFEDKGRYQASFKSITRKYLGVAPWLVTTVTLPLALLSFAAAYHLSTKEAARLARRGIAEIYRVARQDDQWEITFGLGHEQGISAGDEVTILDGQGNPLGTGVVTTVRAGEARASVEDRLIPLTPNAYVCKFRDAALEVGASRQRES